MQPVNNARPNAIQTLTRNQNAFAKTEWYEREAATVSTSAKRTSLSLRSGCTPKCWVADHQFPSSSSSLASSYRPYSSPSAHQ